MRPVDQALKRCAEVIDDRNIECIKHDHWTGGLVAVLVPGHVRRQHHVAGREIEFLTGDCRVSASPFEDEAEGRRNVAM